MELWDIYNKDRIKLKKTHERGKPIVTQRHPEKRYGLLWECSGGAIIVGEESIVGAIRELREEVGLEVDSSELELMHTVRLHDKFVDTYITCKDVKIQDLKLQADEVVSAKFVTYNELIYMWSNGLVVPRERLELYSDKLEQYVIKCLVE